MGSETTIEYAITAVSGYVTAVTNLRALEKLCPTESGKKLYRRAALKNEMIAAVKFDRLTRKG